MSIVYLLKNQHGHYLDKAGEWVSPENSRSLYRSVHKDEALNRKVEFSVKNFDLRISLFEAEINDKGDIEFSDEALAAAAENTAFDFDNAANSAQDSEEQGTTNSQQSPVQHEDLFDESADDQSPPRSHLQAVR